MVKCKRPQGKSTRHYKGIQLIISTEASKHLNLDHRVKATINN